MKKQRLLKIVQSVLSAESGRSMVEMLGVLAIIGVLSIGAVAGYKFAITKYKANETIDELNKRVIVYTNQMDQGMETLTGSEFGATTSMGYRVVATLSTEFENEFQITLQNVPREVCVDLLKNYTIPLESYVGNSLYNRGTDNNEICEDSGADIIFVYQGNLNKPQENGCVEITACTNYDTRCQCVQCEDGYLLQSNLCQNDKCPTGTKKSCGDGYSATFSSTTDAGSNCYTCTYIRPSGGGGYGGQ